jgi:hypothetical protein
MVKTVYEEGWSILSNGELLNIAEEAGYQLLITTDQNLRYQQNLSERKIAVLILLSTSWPRIRQHTLEVREAINTIRSGGYIEISISTSAV